MNPKTPLKSHVPSSFGWAAAGTVGQVIFQLAALATFARILSPAEFGLVSAATIITQLFQILNEFGIGPAIVQREKLSDADIQVGFTLSCLLGGVIILALWTISPILAEIFHVPELTWVIRAYTIGFALKSYSAVAESLMQRTMEFRFLARIDTISFAIGYAGLGILCGLNGFSYWSLVVAQLSQSAIKAGFVLRYRSHSKSVSFDRESVRKFLHFGTGQSISRLGSYVASQGDSFVVAKVLGVERLGEYGRANQLVVMPGNHLGEIFDKVLFPTFSMVQGEKKRLGTAYCRALSIIAMLGLPLAALFYVTAPELSLVLLGERWSNVVEPIKILALGLPFRLLHKISDPTARATGAVYNRAWRQVLVAVTLVAGAYAGSSFGLVGVAYGVLFATLLDAVMMVQLCSQIAEVKSKTILLALSPGVRIGMCTYVIALSMQYFSRLLMESHLEVLAVTLTTVIIALGSIIYILPTMSIGRAGTDVLGYAWTVLHIEQRLGIGPPRMRACPGL
ncbi:MAG TPA: lipopolysaccharide biosynthesis protein [Nitrospira sp.]|nr:lipopolysaccharide biosynthesis protein [Nitrospira sp.]